jgi:hypothetical protein
VQAAEPRQPRREPERGESVGGRDGERPARTRQPLRGCVDLGERRIRDLVELLAGARELQRAVARWKSGWPICSSSVFTSRLIADCVTNSSSAARVKLRWRAAARKPRSRSSERRGGRRRLSILQTHASGEKRSIERRGGAAKNSHRRQSGFSALAGSLATHQEDMAMRARSIASRFSRVTVAGALALALPLPGLAADRTSGATLAVTAHADRYVAAGVSFLDLDTLDALVKPMNASLVRLEACGPASARAFLAAAERYRDVRLELDVLAPTAPECTAVPARAIQVSQAAGPLPVRVAVPSDRYWQGVMP